MKEKKNYYVELRYMTVWEGEVWAEDESDAKLQALDEARDYGEIDNIDSIVWEIVTERS